MRKITIGFSTRPLIGSRLIRWLERSDFSHTLVKWYSEKLDRTLIYQASGTMVNFMSETVFRAESSIMIKEFCLNVTDEEYIQCQQFCIDRAGLPFGFKQILGMGYVKLMARFGKKVNNPFRDGSATYVCSELVGQLLKEVFHIDLKLDLELDGPQELYDKIIQYIISSGSNSIIEIV